MSYILYKTTNLINGKIYVGVSNGNNSLYKGSGTALIKAIKKYGNQNFKREILETFDNEYAAYSREAEVVNSEFIANPNTYNIKVGGKGGIGQLKTDTHKKNISQHIREKYANNEISRNAGRKTAMNNDVLFEYVSQYGIKEAAKKLNLSYYQCRDRYYRAKNQLPL
jgi:type I site-specific restriction-modification system R (restriction) subunit